MFDRLLKKVPDRDAIAADEEPAPGLERLGECIQAGLRLASAAALHFDLLNILSIFTQYSEYSDKLMFY